MVVYAEPRRLEIGQWVLMVYDAEIIVDGLRWLRAEGGFGDNRWPSEDWVCDLPFRSPHVTRDLLGGARTSFRGDWPDHGGRWNCGGRPSYDTMEEAMRAAVDESIGYTKQLREEAARKVEEASECVGRLIESQALRS